jgi:hypothetical protein
VQGTAQDDDDYADTSMDDILVWIVDEGANQRKWHQSVQEWLQAENSGYGVNVEFPSHTHTFPAQLMQHMGGLHSIQYILWFICVCTLIILI